MPLIIYNTFVVDNVPVFVPVFAELSNYDARKKGNKKTRNPLIQRAPGSGADSQIRTGDLILTKDALYRLSYISTLSYDNERILS